jgi:hypothetical protein
MGLFNWLFGRSDEPETGPIVNCDGTPMMPGTNGTVDVEGKPFGVCDNDMSQSEDMLSNNWMSDELDSSSSFDSFDDSFDSGSSFDDW